MLGKIQQQQKNPHQFCQSWLQGEKGIFQVQKREKTENPSGSMNRNYIFISQNYMKIMQLSETDIFKQEEKS
jgi:hypothetical protein